MDAVTNEGASRSATSSTHSLAPAAADEAISSVSNAMGLDDVRKLVKALGIDVSDEEVELMFRESDADGGGSIDDTEFTDLTKRLQAKAGRSISGKLRWRKAIQFATRLLQNEKQKVRQSDALCMCSRIPHHLFQKSARTAKLIEDIRKISEQKASIDLRYCSAALLSRPHQVSNSLLQWSEIDQVSRCHL
jgi:hypothetical protein